MLDTLFGLPAHPLIVHATVVAVPAAVLTVATAGGRLHRHLAPRGFTWLVRGNAGEEHPEPDDPRWSGVPVVFLPDTRLVDPPAPAEDASVVLVRPDRHIAAIGRTVTSVLAARPTPMVRCATGSSSRRPS